MTDNITIQIITPPIADEDDTLDAGLVALTEAIAGVDDAIVSHGALGGEFGYGAQYENAVFLMHPYCWCDRPDCPWCAGCFCESNELRYPLPDGCEPPPNGEDCAWCKGEHRWADKGALPPRKYPHLGAPNFHHKASGLRVWWYKWIGRDMDIVDPAHADYDKVFAECIASLKDRAK